MRINCVEDLPESMREQARRKMGQLCTAAAAMKYHNIRTEVDGHVFDSRREAERYGELQLLYAAKEIAVLMIQVPFPLPGGIIYIADFVYYDLALKEFIVEDAKGVRTKEYLLKKKLMKSIGIEVREV